MFRNILLPGAVLILVAMGVVSFSLWDLFHRQFAPDWSPNQAYDGDVAAQRHLAVCYMTGCTSVPRDPASACAWRHIIANERKYPSPADATAIDNACSHLSVFDRKWIQRLESDIRARMHRQKENSLVGISGRAATKILTT